METGMLVISKWRHDQVAWRTDPVPDNSQCPLLAKQTSAKTTILVGDSGVGKTSLLVQFDQGKFQAGSFAATVGIGFTWGST
ncbi:hypothetical protein CHS0354_033271 [Potamilus streckersoni]|uniref:Uncharacterized protein n=1 Tax=Potamilus streckersoni TaxID=2493646 RepID=A0AAE0S686_9BIVA|nr:hypothetical protein CHS0354_033271 [Potamilus streckersoni]